MRGVTLDNHFHAVGFSEQLPRVMADLKKFTAGKLIAQLKEEGRTWLLDLLVTRKAEHKTSSTYQLWQEGCHPQAIYSEEVMLQKINYVHLNPVRRGGVLSPEHWCYSSANEWNRAGCHCFAVISGAEWKRSFRCVLAFPKRSANFGNERELDKARPIGP